MAASLDNILTSFWDWRLQNSPEFATMIGVHSYDAMLDDLSLSSFTRRQVRGRYKPRELVLITSLATRADMLSTSGLKN